MDDGSGPCRSVDGQIGDGYTVGDTKPNGSCLFESLSMALGNSIAVDDLRRMVADTVLVENDFEVNSVVATWIMLYNSALDNFNPELAREYAQVASVAREPLPLSADARQRLRAAMMAPTYWAEEHALRTLERRLGLRFLVLDSDTRRAVPHLSHREDFCPTAFVALVLKGCHYRPLAYHGRYIFSRDELPDMLRRLFPEYDQ